MSTGSDRKIRTYVLRQGRLTRGQEHALRDYWPRFGIRGDEGELDLAAVFGNSHPVVFEIGFGMGDSLATQAEMNPDNNYLGTEVHRPGVGHLLILAEEKQLSNLRVFSEDGLEVLTRAIPAKSLSGLQLYFPDPWHKKRHHKRRILNPAFMALAASRLEHGGFIHVATDWVPYAEEIAQLFDETPGFERIEAPHRPETKFERRGLRLGHEVRDLACRLTD